MSVEKANKKANRSSPSLFDMSIEKVVSANGVEPLTYAV